MKIPFDKKLHFIAGVLIALVAVPISFELAGLSVVVVALMKEFFDWVSGMGTPDVVDAIYTIVGGAVVIGFYEIIISSLL